MMQLGTPKYNDFDVCHATVHRNCELFTSACQRFDIDIRTVIFCQVCCSLKACLVILFAEFTVDRIDVFC